MSNNKLYRMCSALVLVAVLGVIFLTGRGSSQTTTTVTAAATPSRPAKTYTAYDRGIMHDVEGEIREQMHSIARENPGVEEQLTVQCIADTDRSFSCGASTKLSFPDDYDGKLCTNISGEAKGTVDPSSGETDWKMLSVDSDDDPAPCY